MRENIVSNKSYKNLLKIVIPVTIVIFLTLLICYFCFFNYKHRPYLLNQTEVIFKDSNDNLYFSLNGTDHLKKYDYDNDNHYEMLLYKSNDKYLNYQQSAGNTRFLFVGLNSGYVGEPNGMIRVYDKSFTEIKNIQFGESIEIRGIACTEDTLYCTFKNETDDKVSLVSINIDEDNQTLLSSDLDNKSFYDDGAVHLFFDHLFRIKISFGITTLMWRYNVEYDTYSLTNGDMEILITHKKIIISSANSSFLFSASTNEKYNCIYSKAYLIDDHLLFATYKNAKNYDCGSLDNESGFCICGMEQSYLYDFDAVSQELTLIKQFKSGTYLIDYDLDSFQYYFDGGLYVNDSLFRQCEKIGPYKRDRLGLFDYFRFPVTDYYLSYYNGEFYGI